MNYTLFYKMIKEAKTNRTNPSAQGIHKQADYIDGWENIPADYGNPDLWPSVGTPYPDDSYTPPNWLTHKITRALPGDNQANVQYVPWDVDGNINPYKWTHRPGYNTKPVVNNPIDFSNAPTTVKRIAYNAYNQLPVSNNSSVTKPMPKVIRDSWNQYQFANSSGKWGSEPGKTRPLAKDNGLVREGLSRWMVAHPEYSKGDYSYENAKRLFPIYSYDRQQNAIKKQQERNRRNAARNARAHQTIRASRNPNSGEIITANSINRNPVRYTAIKGGLY